MSRGTKARGHHRRTWPIERATGLLRAHGWTVHPEGHATRTIRGTPAWAAPGAIHGHLPGNGLEPTHVEVVFGRGDGPPVTPVERTLERSAERSAEREVEPEEALVLSHVSEWTLAHRGWTPALVARILDAPEAQGSRRHRLCLRGRPLYERGRVAAAEQLNGIAVDHPPVGVPAWDAEASPRSATPALAWFSLREAAAHWDVPVALPSPGVQPGAPPGALPGALPGAVGAGHHDALLRILDRILLNAGLVGEEVGLRVPGAATRALAERVAERVAGGEGTLNRPVHRIVARSTGPGIASLGQGQWTDARLRAGLEGAALALTGRIPYRGVGGGCAVEVLLREGALRFDGVPRDANDTGAEDPAPRPRGSTIVQGFSEATRRRLGGSHVVSVWVGKGG